MSIELAALELPVDVVSVRVARSAVRSWAAQGGANPDGLEALILVTSELVTNAINATAPGANASIKVVTVRFAIDCSVARLEVDDTGPGRPVVREGSQHGGYGLRLVGDLADRWGCIDRGGHKTVWAEVTINR